METKQCSKCRKVKPLEEFNRTASSADGRHSYCRQCMKEYTRQYRADNSERLKEYAAQYRADYPDYFRKKGRQFRARHPEKLVVYIQHRRAIEAGAEGNFTAEQFTELCNQYGNRCLCCGRDDVPLTVDHVIPISKGGSNDIENCQPLCGQCNSKKHTKAIDYRDTK